MAKNSSTVYLGFEDDSVNEKNKFLVNFTTNKVGGQPNWPSSEILIPPCSICGLKRPLLLQIYAPLDNSQFHRTLYIFSCVNAVCSNQSNGWLCIRVQQIEKVIEKDATKARAVVPNINWCSGANDWDDSEDIYTGDADNSNEQNGNVIRNDNRMSDEDDESNSMESDPLPAFGNLQVDDKNANCGAHGGGAVGRICSPNAYAEIEGDESELVSIDAPVAPQRDLIALLKQTTAIPMDVAKISLRSFFLSVDEERMQPFSSATDHVRELMQDYQSKDEKVRTSPSSPDNGAVGGADAEELYEKGVPSHGDVMFHNFLLTIQENPSQLMRYSRDAAPIVIAPLHELKLLKCQNCGGDLICEVQVLPTLIPKLRFITGDPAPIEYGNVLVYTCIKSCWDTPDKMRIEHVIVQPEI